LERALAADFHPQVSLGYVEYFLAMAEHGMGNAVVAQQHLQNANQTTNKELSESPSLTRKLTLELLREEAERLILPSTSPTTTFNHRLTPGKPR